MELQNRYLRADDIRSEQTWELLAWLEKRGADEFTFRADGLEGGSTPFCDAVETVLSQYRLDPVVRDYWSIPVGFPRSGPTPLWRLNAGSRTVLRTVFVPGLFAYQVGNWEIGCIEDLVVYRSGAIVLGIVSHEREALLSLTEHEHDELAALGIVSRPEPQWI